LSEVEVLPLELFTLGIIYRSRGCSAVEMVRAGGESNLIFTTDPTGKGGEAG
jgi:hypothetical protein